MFHVQNSPLSQNQQQQESLTGTQPILNDNLPLNLRLSISSSERNAGIHPVYVNSFQQNIMQQPALSADTRRSFFPRNYDEQSFSPHSTDSRQTFSPRMEERQIFPGQSVHSSTLSALAAQLTSLAEAQKVFMSNPMGSPGVSVRLERNSHILPSLSNGCPSPSKESVGTPRNSVDFECPVEVMTQMNRSVQSHSEYNIFDNKVTINGANDNVMTNNLSETIDVSRSVPVRSPSSDTDMKNDESESFCPVCDISIPNVDQMKQHMLTNHNVHSVIPEQPSDKEPDYGDNIERPGVRKAAAVSVVEFDVFSSSLSTAAYTKFACTDCGAVFKNKDKLIFHVRHHTSENTLLCTICGKSFFKSDKLARHMLVHSGERPYVCKHCGATFTRSDKLRAHLRARHGDESYSCRVCRESFQDIVALKLHLSKRRCSKYRPSENEAEDRRRRERDALESTFNEIAAQIGDPEIDIALMVNRERLAASFDASIARDGELDATALKDSVLKDINDDRVPDGHTYKASAEFMDETVIVPEVNQERAKAKASHAKKIDKIVKRINKYRTVACPHCDLMLPGAYTLTRHLRIAHSIIKSYQYKKKEKVPRVEGEEVVPRVRIKRPALIKHCQCLICGKNFTKLDTLKRHEVTHTGERAFQCRYVTAHPSAGM